MADTKINGSEWFFFIDPAGGVSYDTLICLTSSSLKRASSSIDAASNCGPDTRAGAQTVSVDIAGQVVFVPDAGKVSEGELHDLWAAKTLFSWKLARAIPQIGDVEYTGFGTLLSLDLNGDTNSVLTFTGNVGVSGIPSKTVYPGS